MTVYTTSEVAEILQVSSATVRNEVKRGKLNCFYVGVEARFTDWHLSEYMATKFNLKSEREIELEHEISELKYELETKERTLSNILKLVAGQ